MRIREGIMGGEGLRQRWWWGSFVWDGLAWVWVVEPFSWFMAQIHRCVLSRTEQVMTIGGEKALLPLLGRNQRWMQGRACCSLAFTPPSGTSLRTECEDGNDEGAVIVAAWVPIRRQN